MRSRMPPGGARHRWLRKRVTDYLALQEWQVVRDKAAIGSLDREGRIRACRGAQLDRVLGHREELDPPDSRT